MNEVKLTSVKVITELYKKFKNKTIDDEFSLQKLVNSPLIRLELSISFSFSFFINELFLLITNKYGN